MNPASTPLVAQNSEIGSSFVFPLEDETIRYDAPPADDPVAKLQARIDRGEWTLRFDPKRGYLPALLEALGVPASSQMLVFSKTSFQLHRISPATPRAIYFNDTVYLGWVQDGDVMEVSSVDPVRGGMFYTLDQRPSAKPRFVRRGECLQCHASPNTLGVPGHMVRSVFPDPDGMPYFQAGTFLTDHRSPLKERWGGWYVTGTHGQQLHMGNTWVTSKDKPDVLDRKSGANLTRLEDLFDTAPYQRPTSDLVALLVLEHQARMHNLITRAGFETRSALTQQAAINKAFNRPASEWSDSTRRRIHRVADALLHYSLFTEEPPLEAKTAGVSSFREDFEKLGPFDSKGRSLRQFDLEHRMFRYPLSYLIYSEAFDQLPAELREVYFARLADVLSGKDKAMEFQRLNAADRRAIFEILLATKANLPALFRAGGAAPAATGRSGADASAP